MSEIQQSYHKDSVLDIEFNCRNVPKVLDSIVVGQTTDASKRDLGYTPDNGNSYFVNKAGNDGNAGTIESPLLTLDAAHEKCYNTSIKNTVITDSGEYTITNQQHRGYQTFSIYAALGCAPTVEIVEGNAQEPENLSFVDKGMTTISSEDRFWAELSNTVICKSCTETTSGAKSNYLVVLNKDSLALVKSTNYEILKPITVGASISHNCFVVIAKDSALSTRMTLIDPNGNIISDVDFNGHESCIAQILSIDNDYIVYLEKNITASATPLTNYLRKIRYDGSLVSEQSVSFLFPHSFSLNGYYYLYNSASSNNKTVDIYEYDSSFNSVRTLPGSKQNYGPPTVLSDRVYIPAWTNNKIVINALFSRFDYAMIWSSILNTSYYVWDMPTPYGDFAMLDKMPAGRIDNNYDLVIANGGDIAVIDRVKRNIVALPSIAGLRPFCYCGGDRLYHTLNATQYYDNARKEYVYWGQIYRAQITYTLAGLQFINNCNGVYLYTRSNHINHLIRTNSNGIFRNSRFSHYGSYAQDPSVIEWAAIYQTSNMCDCILDKCLILNCLGGVYGNQSKWTITNSQFSHINYSYALKMVSNSDSYPLLINHCDFASCVGGVSLVSNSQYGITIKNNIYHRIADYCVKADVGITIANSIVNGDIFNVVLANTVLRCNPFFVNNGIGNTENTDLHVQSINGGYTNDSMAIGLADDNNNAGSIICTYPYGVDEWDRCRLTKQKIDIEYIPVEGKIITLKSGDVYAIKEGESKKMTLTFKAMLNDEFTNALAIATRNNNLKVKIYLDPITNPLVYEVFTLDPTQTINGSPELWKLSRTGVAEVKLVFIRSYEVAA